MSALAVSANREKEKLIDSRREPVRAYTGKPAAKLVTRLLVAATELLGPIAVGSVVYALMFWGHRFLSGVEITLF